MAMALLLAVAVIPANAQAEGIDIYSGTGTLTYVEPIAVTFSECSANSAYDADGHIWTVSVVGGGTATLSMLATNNGSDPVTVYVEVSQTNPQTYITTSWNQLSYELAAGDTEEFVLTAVIGASVPAGDYPITFKFTR
jgi:hypothetical protein